MFYIHLIQSKKNSSKLYVGSTNNLKWRLSEHNNKKVCSTLKHSPWKLIYSEAFLSEKDARLKEQKLKHHDKGKPELKKRLSNSLEKSAG
ncbi:MAG: excinuclease ABC subunit C [Candidatus Buchananbacteria bacterium CG10_big_fil_rev_8_21_14_0_10_42_9]|uniref:Excinuclease ABC subunit C n=1 Tax=Candidatus Buchananbacteria bacterium CG10_big_fil_rev_8_21_14_0_10_42_9 TaxID=1974526 RepID=A0A2H0W003_9BACT|nr:MAG: excinuclease ABC subunit C [Candidatus Buchananbacteria bacterium CG10_big_fil_rev_8_21_14_0_10_42_9]